MAFRTGITLQLGPISATVNLDSSVERPQSLKTVCLGTPGSEHVATGVKQSTACPSCGNSDYSTFKKAQVEKKEFIVLEQDEVTTAKEAAIGATKDIISLSVHPVEAVRTQTIQGEGVYHLSPYKPGLAPLYQLMRDVMERHPELAFMGMWSPSGRPNLYEVRLFGDTLVMEGRCRPEQLKVVQQPRIEIPASNQQQIDQLLPMVISPFDPALYSDVYAASLAELVASKEAQEGVLVPGAKSTKTAASAGVVDLTALLGGLLGEAA